MINQKVKGMYKRRHNNTMTCVYTSQENVSYSLAHFNDEDIEVCRFICNLVPVCVCHFTYL
jgi:hypothetical protein